MRILTRFGNGIGGGCERRFIYLIGVVDRAQLECATQEFLQKPYGLNIFPVQTAAERKVFAAGLEDETISLVTIKKAGERSAIIFRLLNNTENCVDTAICVEKARLPLHFGKFEVKTVLYENGELTESELLRI